MWKKADILLIVGVVVLIAAFVGYFRLQQGSDGRKVAVIKQENRVIRTIDLDTVTKAERIQIGGAYPEVILVEKGRIRFEEADCPDKVCVRTGWLTRRGQTAACLPNRTLIKIEGVGEEVDGGTY